MLWAALLGATSLSAQTPSQIEGNSIALGIKTGYSQSGTEGLDAWLVQEGLPKADENRVGHTLLGFDLMFELGRVPIGLSPTFHFTGQERQMIFLTDITLQSGYTVVKKDPIELKALAGLGLVFAGWDFQGIPSSFQSVAADYSSPYARLSAFAFRPSLMFSHKPKWRTLADGSRDLHYQRALYFQAGLNYFFHHRWKYGEVSNNSIQEDNSFSGVPVNMPDVLKSNLFVTIGLAFSMHNQRAVSP